MSGNANYLPPNRPARENVVWELIQRIRMIIQMILALAIEVYDNLPDHHYWPGATIGLGLLLVTVAEVVIRWLRERAGMLGH